MLSRMADLPKVISVDDHVMEPGDVWTSRLPARYAAIGPHVEYLPPVPLVGGQKRPGPVDPGAVDEHINRPDLGEGAGHVRGDGQIDLVGRRPRKLVGDRANP